MNLQIKLGLIFLMSVLVTACVSTPLKAPCDQHATFCGVKTKINNG